MIKKQTTKQTKTKKKQNETKTKTKQRQNKTNQSKTKQKQNEQKMSIFHQKWIHQSEEIYKQVGYSSRSFWDCQKSFLNLNNNYNKYLTKCDDFMHTAHMQDKNKIK